MFLVFEEEIGEGSCRFEKYMRPFELLPRRSSPVLVCDGQIFLRESVLYRV